MSKNKQSMRVLIAEDVMRHLAAETFVIRTNCYASWSIYTVDERPEFIWEELLSAQLKKAKPCGVCAKGAAFIAAVNRFNTLTAGDVLKINNFGDSALDHEGMHDYLFTLFDQKNLNAIEAAFEGWSETTQMDNQQGLGSEEMVRDDLLNYRNLTLEASCPEIRLGMIMRNVIKNDGTFMPQEFIDEIKNGYDHTVLDGWMPKPEKDLIEA